MEYLSQKVMDNALLSTLENPEYRWGQALFNSYHEIAPDLANQIRGTDKDPFYASGKKDESVFKFFEFLHENNVELIGALDKLRIVDEEPEWTGEYVQSLPEDLPKGMLVPLKDEYIMPHDSDKALEEGKKSMGKLEA